MDGQWIVPGYRHIRVLGDGASGRVLHAEHIDTGTPVAIKYLSDALRRDEEFLERFRGEARLLAELRDPNVVTFHEYVEAPQGAAIVMELVNGVSLAALLESEGPTQPEAALVVLKGSLLGLAAAHAAGVIHRDYKPGNVLVSNDGSSRLADFGVAVKEGTGAPAAGTPAYMAPEQWGGPFVGPASDVYAATAVFFECLTGERPYMAKTIHQLAVAHRTADIPVERVPEQLRSLVGHGLAKDPLDRPQSAQAFLGELEAVAFAAYGVDWEERGRNSLKERVALLALLLPLGRAPQGAATAVALTELGGGPSGRRGKVAAVAAAVTLGLLVLGGGTAAVVASSGSSTPLAGSTATPTADPSVDPSADPSGDPSSTPTVDESPTDSPTPTPSPSATTTSPAPGGGSGGGNGGAPNPKPTTKKPVVKPPVVKPVPFKVTGVSVSVGTPVKGISTFTVSVSTAGRPPSTVSLAISSSAGVVAPSGSIPPGGGSYSGQVQRVSICQPFTVSVTATPGGVSGSGSFTPTDPDCNQIG